jgi:hypothetical protein
MSELGMGDERFGSDDADVGAKEYYEGLDSEVYDQGKSDGDLNGIKGLPVVVIRGFEDKIGGRSELLDVVAQWATSLVDNRVSELWTSTFCELIGTSYV